MVSCYQNATGIELLDDCFVIHNKASPDELFGSRLAVNTVLNFFT